MLLLTTARLCSFRVGYRPRALACMGKLHGAPASLGLHRRHPLPLPLRRRRFYTFATTANASRGKTARVCQRSSASRSVRRQRMSTRAATGAAWPGPKACPCTSASRCASRRRPRRRRQTSSTFVRTDRAKCPLRARGSRTTGACSCAPSPDSFFQFSPPNNEAKDWPMPCGNESIRPCGRLSDVYARTAGPRR